MAALQAEFDGIMQLMTEAHVELEAAINTLNYHALSETPTASPIANRVIKAAQWFMDGKGPRELMQGQAQNYQDQIRKAIAQLQMASRLPAESTVVSEEAPKMLTAMEAMDEVMEVLKASENHAEITATLAHFEKAVADLSASEKIVQEHNENFGKIICLHCQTPNPHFAKMCETCNRRLPEFAGSDVYGDAAGKAGQNFVFTKTMKELQDACMDYERGSLSQADFITHLRGQEDKLRIAETKMARFKLPDIPADASPAEKQQIHDYMRWHRGAEPAGAGGRPLHGRAHAA